MMNLKKKNCALLKNESFDCLPVQNVAFQIKAIKATKNPKSIHIQCWQKIIFLVMPYNWFSAGSFFSGEMLEMFNFCDLNCFVWFFDSFPFPFPFVLYS